MLRARRIAGALCRAACALLGPALGASSLAACAEEARSAQLEWSVSFACELDRETATRLTLDIVRGGCEGDTSVFAATVGMGEAAAPPADLAPGRYGFVAEAQGGADVVTSACVEVELPRREAVALVLPARAAACGDAGEQLDGGDPAQQDGAVPLDASGVDAAATPDAGADGDAGEPTESDAGSDAGQGCGCSCSPDSCSCSSASCAAGFLFMTVASADPSASWQPSSGLSVSAASVARMAYARDSQEPLTLLADPAPVVLLPESLFDTVAAIDALSVLSDGRIAFSTAAAAELSGEPIAQDEIVIFDPLSQALTRMTPELRAYISAVSGHERDLDALYIEPDGDVYFSVSEPIRVNASSAEYAPTDLLLFDGSSVQRIVNGSLAWSGRNLEAIAVNPRTGNFLVSLTGSGGFGGGPSFDAGDVIELAFGPGDAIEAGYTLFLKADEALHQAGERVTGFDAMDP